MCVMTSWKDDSGSREKKKHNFFLVIKEVGATVWVVYWKEVWLCKTTTNYFKIFLWLLLFEAPLHLHFRFPYSTDILPNRSIYLFVAGKTERQTLWTLNTKNTLLLRSFRSHSYAVRNLCDCVELWVAEREWPSVCNEIQAV